MEKTKEQIEQFLRELRVLTRRHGIIIEGEGPFLKLCEAEGGQPQIGVYGERWPDGTWILSAPWGG